MPIAPYLHPALLPWYDANAADLPWRSSPTAYHTWLSEIMLQQTQIETVRFYYSRFLNEYPTIADLAQASLDAVLKLWEGLGYYSRARNLHRTAKIIHEQYQGQFPSDPIELQKLPGIGPYTAGAIASIAFDVPAAVLDGNVIRVFSRIFDIEEDVSLPATKNKLWALAQEQVPEKRAGDYNQALMELGQKLCRPLHPDCGACPVQGFCLSYARGNQNERPVKQKKAPVPHIDVAAGIIRNEAGLYLIAQRKAEGLLGGLWEFPGGKQEVGESLEACLQRELQEELAILVEVDELFIKVKHAFTHFKMSLYAYECRYIRPLAPYSEPQKLDVADWEWVSEAGFHDRAFGKADREIIKAIESRSQRLF
ncbi:A/G-specific adenine glycosylase [Anaerolineales bacterium]